MTASVSPLTTAPMAWHGPALSADDRDLLSLLDQVAADRDVVASDDPTIVDDLIGQLAELGLWTVGAAESVGGGGAEPSTTFVVWERLGRYWPALGWASVQAHAALTALGEETLASGARRAAVVDLAAPHVRLQIADGRARGRIDRVDAATPDPELIVLDGSRTLHVQGGLTATPLDRSGLAGARTVALDVDAPVRELDASADDLRQTLATGAVLVGAGIGGAAADTAAAYAAERHQFGGPILDLPTVAAAVERLRRWNVTTLAAAWGIGDSLDRAAAVWARAATELIDVAADAVQIHGGYGFLTEYPVERHLRDAVSLRAAAWASTLTTGANS